MCLSTAYLNEKKEETIVARYVAQVKCADGKIVLSDIIGAETEIVGTISFIDLEGGTVIIKTDAA
ncbi:MAG: CooT family nickel-binding protein [Clostridiales bacterium]|nr:CooT family nickel-binding protein [Candidatus Apopatocola equi]MCQ2438845.1 CooT family nickel-binding protein [Oscillospiraceae bacterium]